MKKITMRFAALAMAVVLGLGVNAQVETATTLGAPKAAKGLELAQHQLQHLDLSTLKGGIATKDANDTAKIEHLNADDHSVTFDVDIPENLFRIIYAVYDRGFIEAEADYYNETFDESASYYMRNYGTAYSNIATTLTVTKDMAGRSLVAGTDYTLYVVTFATNAADDTVGVARAYNFTTTGTRPAITFDENYTVNGNTITLDVTTNNVTTGFEVYAFDYNIFRQYSQYYQMGYISYNQLLSYSMAGIQQNLNAETDHTYSLLFDSLEYMGAYFFSYAAWNDEDTVGFDLFFPETSSIETGMGGGSGLAEVELTANYDASETDAYGFLHYLDGDCENDYNAPLFTAEMNAECAYYYVTRLTRSSAQQLGIEYDDYTAIANYLINNSAEPEYNNNSRLGWQTNNEGQVYHLYVIPFNADDQMGTVKNINYVMGETASVETVETMQVSVYPNPAINTVKVSGMEMQRVELYNTLGQLVMSQNVNGEQAELNVSNIAAGSYLILAHGSNGTLGAAKVVVE